MRPIAPGGNEARIKLNTRSTPGGLRRSIESKSHLRRTADIRYHKQKKRRRRHQQQSQRLRAFIDNLVSLLDERTPLAEHLELLTILPVMEDDCWARLLFSIRDELTRIFPLLDRSDVGDINWINYSVCELSSELRWTYGEKLQVRVQDIPRAPRDATA